MQGSCMIRNVDFVQLVTFPGERSIPQELRGQRVVVEFEYSAQTERYGLYVLNGTRKLHGPARTYALDELPACVRQTVR